MVGHPLPLCGPHVLASPTASLGHPVPGPPQDPAVNEIPLPQSGSRPLGISIDAMGNVWFSDSNTDRLIEFVPGNQSFRSFAIPTSAHSTLIWFLIFDKRGDLWFSDATHSGLWRYTPSTDRFQNFSTGAARPYALAYDSASDEIWFSSTYTNQFGVMQLSPSGAKLGGLVTLPPFGFSGEGPAGIALDGEGHVYVAQNFAARIAEYYEANLTLAKSWYLGNSSRPTGLALDGLGRLWFTNHATSFFGYISTRTGVLVQYSTSLTLDRGSPIVSLPYWVTLSQNGDVWFDEHFGNRIARYDPFTKQLTEFNIPTNNSSPLALSTDGRSGRLWFTEFASGRIGWIQENESFGLLHTSTPALTVTQGGEANFSAYVVNGTGNPALTGTMSRDGELASNLSTSIRPGAGGYSVTFRTASVLPGDYTVMFCVETPETRLCTPLSVSVQAAPFPTLTILLVAVAVVALAFLAYLVFGRSRFRLRAPLRRRLHLKSARPAIKTAEAVRAISSRNSDCEDWDTTSFTTAE